MLSKLVMLAILFGGNASFLIAQSNDRLDELLGQAPAQLDSTLYLVLASVAVIPESATPAEALDAAVTNGLVGKDQHASDPVTIQTLSFFLMKTLKTKGGLEWSLLPNPRAAYRELAFHDLINASAGPDRLISGDEVVRAYSAVKSYTEGH